MEKTGWKILAIIFIVLFGWGVYLVEEETKQTNLCYYEVCEGYVEALLSEGVCSCFEYDLLNNLVVAKNKVM